MTKVHKNIIVVLGVVALLAMVLLAGCGSGGNSSASTTSGSETSAVDESTSARIIDVDIYLKSDTSTEMANGFVDAIKKVEGVVDAEFKPATANENACIHYSVIQGTSTVAIEDMLMEMDGFADVFIQKPPMDVLNESASASSNDAQKTEASDSSEAIDAESAFSESVESVSSETAQSTEQENSDESEAASQE